MVNINSSTVHLKVLRLLDMSGTGQDKDGVCLLIPAGGMDQIGNGGLCTDHGFVTNNFPFYWSLSFKSMMEPQSETTQQQLNHFQNPFTVKAIKTFQKSGGLSRMVLEWDLFDKITILYLDNFVTMWRPIIITAPPFLRLGN